jgi:hypothetical protein
MGKQPSSPVRPVTNRALLSAALAFVCLASTRAQAVGVPGVGTTRAFPPAAHSGAPVDFQLWQWGNKPGDRREVMPLQNGDRLPFQSLPASGIHFKFAIHSTHDSLSCQALSTDSFDRIAWGPEAVPEAGSAGHLYRAYPESFVYPPQVGHYCLDVEATLHGKPVARSVIQFDIVDVRKIPANTTYFKGKLDYKGDPITDSRPVQLGPLNQTPVFKDNDYAFEPQRAYNLVNFERFPPFKLPSRFIIVWNSRRFTDEDKFGGPLNRGFTSLATIDPAQDNLPINQRTWFHTPDLQVMLINQWYAKDPAKNADLKAYADYRSAFVSAENAYRLGWECYSSWGAGGYGPYDPGLYGWDEEQMWPTIAEKLLKEHPEVLPEDLQKLKDKDPDLNHPDTLAILNDAYMQAWGDFIANGYRGARACAASHGRVIKVWHYGSKAPGDFLFLNKDDAAIDQATGVYRAEEIGSLWPWFKKDGKVDFDASEYSREVDFFNKDFYYMTDFPMKESMYEKDASGAYRLDGQRRRLFRTKPFAEALYGSPIKLGYEDCETSPVFLKAFLAKGENTLFWMNGGKYYGGHGTLLANKMLIPTLRPGNQETWGKSADFGSRPISPYLAEASVIYTFMMGLEGMYLWDSRGFTGPAGYGPAADPNRTDTLGDMEFMVKGLHRLSQFDSLFEGNYSFVRPIRYYDTWNRDHPIIRGILNGRYLLVAMTNPYLDPGETQKVDVWYDAPYHAPRKPAWTQEVILLARHTQLFQCKLPVLPTGRKYDPSKLYFRYTCSDGTYHKTYYLTGNYDVPYPYATEE